MDREETPLKQIRTFQGDVVEAIRRQQESLVSIQRAEHLRGGSIQSITGASLEDSKKRKEFFLFLLGSFVLFIMGTVGAWYTYNEFVRKATVPITATLANRFLSSNTEIDFKLEATSRETLINTLPDAIGGVPHGELRHVVLRKVVGDENPLLSTSEFLEMLGSRAPGSLVRAFDPLFMFGALGKSTFLIIKLASFENAFAGMLSWERNVAADIGPLFATAPLLRDMPPESVFTDITDRNKDIRILALGDQPILLYSFFDNNMLIITDGVESLRTLIDRLTREKLSR